MYTNIKVVVPSRNMLNMLKINVIVPSRNMLIMGSCKTMLTRNKINVAFHKWILPKDVVYFHAPIITWHVLIWQPYGHSFKHWRASKYHFQEIRLMILPFEAFDFHLFKIQRDSLGSPALWVITRTIKWAHFFHL